MEKIARFLGGEKSAESQARHCQTNPNPNLSVRISSGGAGVFHVKGWGPKRSLRPSKARETKLFRGISRDFGGISLGCPKCLRRKSQGPPNGGVSNGGVSRSGLVLPFLSFFSDFPDFSGIFPICSGMVRGFSRFVLFLFLGLLRAPTRNSPERVRDTIWTFPEKSGKHPGLETPQFSFSQKSLRSMFGPYQLSFCNCLSL